MRGGYRADLDGKRSRLLVARHLYPSRGEEGHLAGIGPGLANSANRFHLLNSRIQDVKLNCQNMVYLIIP